MGDPGPKTAGLLFSFPTVLNWLAVIVIVLAVTVLIGRPGYDQLKLRYYLSRYSRNPISNSRTSFVSTPDGPLTFRWPTFDSLDSLSIFALQQFPNKYVEFVYVHPVGQQTLTSGMVKDYPYSYQSVEVCFITNSDDPYPIEDLNTVFKWPQLRMFVVDRSKYEVYGGGPRVWADSPRRLQFMRTVVEEWYQAHQDAGGKLPPSESEMYFRRIVRMGKRSHPGECCAGPAEEMWE